MELLASAAVETPMRSLALLLLVVLSLAIPAQALQSRDEAQATLRKLGIEHAAPPDYLVHPEGWRWSDPLTPPGDEEARKARHEAIQQLVILISRCKQDKWVLADFKVLLAQLWLEEAWDVKQSEELPKYNARREEWERCRSSRPRKKCGREPIPDHQRSHAFRKHAIESFDGALRFDPSPERRAEVRFRREQLHWRETEPRDKRLEHLWEAKDAAEQLLKAKPSPRLASNILVDLGDMLQEDRQEKVACATFEQADELLQDDSGRYARLQAAICRHRRGDQQRAITELQRLVHALNGSKWKLAKVRERALLALFVSYSESERIDTAMEFAASELDVSTGRRYLTLMARNLAQLGKHATAVAAFRSLLAEAPDDEYAPSWHAGLLYSLEASKSPKLAAEAQVLVQRYGEGSTWREKHAGNAAAVELAARVVGATTVFAE